MKNGVILTAALILVTCTSVFSQGIFKEKFEGCNTQQFAMEKLTTTAKIKTAQLVYVLTNGFDEGIKKEIRGDISLQILVDLQGKSCLLSMENGTNVATDKLNLKTAIDKLLVWEKPPTEVSALVLLRFEEGELKVKRVGMDGNAGFHELTE